MFFTWIIILVQSWNLITYCNYFTLYYPSMDTSDRSVTFGIYAETDFFEF